MIAYLHYADNYHSKILAMFYHQNEMIYEHFSAIPCKLIHERLNGVCTAAVSCLLSGFVYITPGWRSWRIYSLYAIKMLVKHLVMMEKHCNHFAMFIICIMQVCHHKSSLYFVFRAKIKNNVVASLSLRQCCSKDASFLYKINWYFKFTLKKIAFLVLWSIFYLFFWFLKPITTLMWSLQRIPLFWYWLITHRENRASKTSRFTSKKWHRLILLGATIQT